VSERAYQQAVAYARDRVQSRDLAGSPGRWPSSTTRTCAAC
jgi:alkylation response protein AidB-like acyl-CoA dehydrogenase